MTDHDPSNTVTKEAALIILEHKRKEAESLSHYLQTAVVFVEAVPVPDDAPEAYRITETALRKSMIVSALSANQQHDILQDAWDRVSLIE